MSQFEQDRAPFLVQEGRMMVALSQPSTSMKCGMCMALQFLRIPDGDACHYLMAGYEDGTLALWDVAAKSRPKAVQKLHGEPIMALATHGQGETWEYLLGSNLLQAFCSIHPF